MVINQLIALLLPGVVTLKMYEKLEGEENRVQKLIKKYLKAILVINIFMYLIVIYIMKIPQFIFTNQFTVKYILLAIVVGTTYPLIEKLIRSNIGIEVGVEKQHEKKD